MDVNSYKELAAFLVSVMWIITVSKFFRRLLSSA